ncbi:unnamed protein product [Anisakis simplex]|uniref:Uncharacterized protein n=1 Tax=Anisakis simplex TaxID=6269 RepID=A0A0M3JB97_ANISI|nr:unnamed protein product [Anisakis simplex]
MPLFSLDVKLESFTNLPNHFRVIGGEWETEVDEATIQPLKIVCKMTTDHAQTSQVCVSKCPNKTFTYLQLQTVPSGPKFEKEVRENVICDDEPYKATITNFNELHELVKRGVCAPYTVPSAAGSLLLLLLFLNEKFSEF